MSLTQKSITGILYSFAEQISRRGIGILTTLLLAMFLIPADYGLIAMMAVFLTFANTLMDSGFKQALIRLQNVTQTELNTAFYANLGLAVLSYLLLFLTAPLIANFYREPRLVVLLRVAALTVPINAFQVTQNAVLSKELNFKAQLQASIPSNICSGIMAAVLAYVGFGVWALIVQMLLTTFLNTLLLWIIQGWRPTFGFCSRALGRMYNFGYKLFLAGLLDTLFKNIYVIVIAKFFTATVAGYYFFADRLKELVISQIVNSIQDVAYPALTTLQNDDYRLKLAYRKVIAVTTFLLFPTMLLLAALADPLFIFLLPRKWFPAASYLQLMCIAGVMYPVHAINLNLLKVKGRSDLFLYLEAIKKLMILAILCISAHFGIIGILIGQIIHSVLAYIPNSYFSASLINYSVREQLADFMPGLSLSILVALAIYGLGYLFRWTASAKFVTLALMACIIYLVGARILRLHAYALARQMLMERINARWK